MTPSLIPASEIRVGDLLEHPISQVWVPVRAIDKQFGRLWFVIGDRVVSRSALVDDLMLVGRVE